jgi:hypothetical protein
MIYYFQSDIQVRGSFPANFSDEELKNEPMFFNCDLNFCLKNGGPITRSFLENMPGDWKKCHPVIDSRVHMLMSGWCPAIPGFHHDDVPRNTPTGQPNYDNLDYYSQHLTGVVNADVAPTLFALGRHTLPKIESGVIYREWHPSVLEQLQNKILIPYEIKSGEYIQFDWQSMHTAQKAVKNGWRWFIRLSRKTERQFTVTNEIRRQVQVYLENPTDGW